MIVWGFYDYYPEETFLGRVSLRDNYKTSGLYNPSSFPDLGQNSNTDVEIF